ncbi:hypothetical protein NicSoilB8_21230 [Arthrobacter sp. NicSoilB8]|nr:hypothetical protein NicSoilB8_21230 [Arthrobacter sp. NicSoilB8]
MPASQGAASQGGEVPGRLGGNCPGGQWRPDYPAKLNYPAKAEACWRAAQAA